MILLRQKLYARRDYRGLTPEQQELLHAKRSDVASKLMELRRQESQNIQDLAKREGEGLTSLHTRSNYSGGAALGSGISGEAETKTTRKAGESLQDFINRHHSERSKSMASGSKDRARILKEQARAANPKQAASFLYDYEGPRLQDYMTDKGAAKIKAKKLQEEINKDKEETKKFFKVESAASKKEEKYINELKNKKSNIEAAEKRLKSIKKANVRKVMKKAAPWVGATAALGTGAAIGISAYNKNKKKK